MKLTDLIVDDVEGKDAKSADAFLTPAAPVPVVLARCDPGEGVAHRIRPALLLCKRVVKKDYAIFETVI